jgi:hypothetical protein
MSGSYHIRLPGEETRRGEPHPTWITVGCVLVVGLPALGYLLAEYLLQLNFQRHYLYIPPELAWPPGAPYLLVKLAIAALSLLIGTGLFTSVFGLIWPLRPGKYDSPNLKRPLPKIKKWR